MSNNVPVAGHTGPISHTIFRIQRLHRMRAGQLLRSIGLYPTQELVLMQLWEHGPQRQTDLVRLLGSDSATMTRTITRLETAGFVHRRPCTDDKRATIVEATVASNAIRNQVDDAWAQLERDTTSELSPQQQQDLHALLKRVERNLLHATEARSPQK